MRTKSKNLTLGLAAILLMLSAGSAFAATTIYDLLWYGQSLSVGAFGQPLLTPFAPYPSFVWMMYSSCDGLHSPNPRS